MPETATSNAASAIFFRGGLGMSARNTPQKRLESWKQIAGYLDRSERTVRRWEANEGLPVHRLEHEKQDTVFAYRHEIEAWSRLRTKCPREISIDEGEIPAVAKRKVFRARSQLGGRNHLRCPLIRGCRLPHG
jgi:hypothetical protein